jgi:hypothetical protein
MRIKSDATAALRISREAFEDVFGIDITPDSDLFDVTAFPIALYAGPILQEIQRGHDTETESEPATDLTPCPLDMVKELIERGRGGTFITDMMKWYEAKGRFTVKQEDTIVALYRKEVLK